MVTNYRNKDSKYINKIIDHFAAIRIKCKIFNLMEEFLLTQLNHEFIS